MSRKMIIGLVILVSILALGIEISCPNPVFAMGEKPPKQEYKTHVSKYGFSVSYPKDWYLEEIWRTASIPESKRGWLDFVIANKDPHFYIPLGGDSIEIHFTGFVDELKNSPSDISNKLKYFADKYGMRSIEKKEILRIGNEIFYLAYGVPRGHSYKFHVLIFYLPKTKKITMAIIRSTGEYNVDGLLKAIKIKIYDSD